MVEAGAQPHCLRNGASRGAGDIGERNYVRVSVANLTTTLPRTVARTSQKAALIDNSWIPEPGVREVGRIRIYSVRFPQ